MHIQQFTIKGDKVKSLIPHFQQQLNPQFSVAASTEKTFMFCGESFSFWQDSDMAITIFLDLNSDEICTGFVVVSGGKQGLLRWDMFGREQSRVDAMMRMINKICAANNYSLELKVE